MVPLTALWLPIVLSAVIVFVASSIMHMVLPYHRGDLRKVPKEDEVMEALRKFNIPPGDYGLPHPGSMAGMKKNCGTSSFWAYSGNDSTTASYSSTNGRR